MAKHHRSRQSMAPSKVKVLSAKANGVPIEKHLRRDFPKTVLRRLQRRQTVNTLIKKHPDGTTNDVATLPQDANGNMIPNGVLTPGSGGYKGVEVFVKDQRLTPKLAKGTKRVKTPRPLGTGRIRNPYRIGRGK